MYYLATSKLTRQNSDGSLKPTKETFLLDSVSYTEAERIFYKIMDEGGYNEFSIVDIKKSNINEVLDLGDSEGMFYIAKIKYITVEASSDKEVKVNTIILVSAVSIAEANERIQDSFSSILVPYDIYHISKSKIVEFFPYLGDEQNDGQTNNSIIE